MSKSKRLAERFNSAGHTDNSRGTRLVSECNPGTLALAITRVVAQGDAILIGSTSDGGCVVITILSGDERQKFYPNDEGSLSAALSQIAEAYQELPATGKEKNGKVK
jgi:hypothetical protein